MSRSPRTAESGAQGFLVSARAAMEMLYIGVGTAPPSSPKAGGSLSAGNIQTRAEAGLQIKTKTRGLILLSPHNSHLSSPHDIPPPNTHVQLYPSLETHP